MEGGMLISELARETGIPVHTLRYYEKYGLFRGKKDHQTKSNNYTWYDRQTVERLELVKEAKEIGFTLAEIKKLIDAWHSKKMSPEKKLEILQEKIREIDQRIQQLKGVKKLLVAGMEEVREGLC
jgi:MerR family transcriptional regulator, copper efflux regulator